LKRKDREYENEIHCLTYRNLELQERLRTLKFELNSQGHHVDQWLHSCPELDRYISTCSASEAEMYRSFDDYDEQISTTKSILHIDHSTSQQTSTLPSIASLMNRHAS